MSTPPLHPEWLITFWLTTPVIRNLEPHVTMLVILIMIIGLAIYFIKRNKAEKPDEQEIYFQHLLQQKQMIEGKMQQLEKKLLSGQIITENDEKKLLEYQKYLNKVKKDLLQFTE